MKYQNDITLKVNGSNAGPSISFPHALLQPLRRVYSFSPLSLRCECVFGELHSAFEDILTFLRMLEWQLMKCAGSLGLLWSMETWRLAGHMFGGGTFLSGPESATIINLQT